MSNSVESVMLSCAVLFLRSKSRKDQIERKPFSEGIVENTLARPEFSSTLRVKKEISELKVWIVHII